MRISDSAVGYMLSEIHGLLHEAKSNVEIDHGKGQQLIARVAASEAAHSAGTLATPELIALMREIGDVIRPSIEKELSIENPDAAVIQIRALLDNLEKVS